MTSLTKTSTKKRTKRKANSTKSTKETMTDNYFNSFTTKEELDKEINRLEGKIEMLKGMKTKFKFIDTFNINKNQLKRTFDFNVSQKYSCSRNPNDEYSKNIESKLEISYKYVMIEFVSPTELIKKNYEIHYDVWYNCYKSYENRHEPDIEAGYNLTVCDENGNDIDFIYNEEEEEEIKYDNSGGEWGHVLKSIHDYVMNGNGHALCEDEGKRELIESLND